MSRPACPACRSTAVTGVEYPEVADAVLHWVCLACNVAWRCDFPDVPMLAALSAREVTAWNLAGVGGRR